LIFLTRMSQDIELWEQLETFRSLVEPGKPLEPAPISYPKVNKSKMAELVSAKNALMGGK
jgi:hypothetical protein